MKCDLMCASSEKQLADRAGHQFRGWAFAVRRKPHSDGVLCHRAKTNKCLCLGVRATLLFKRMIERNLGVSAIVLLAYTSRLEHESHRRLCQACYDARKSDCFGDSRGYAALKVYRIALHEEPYFVRALSTGFTCCNTSQRKRSSAHYSSNLTTEYRKAA